MIRRKHSSRFLEKSCSSIFGVIVFGDLELTCSAIWRNRVWRFGVNVFGDLEKSCSAIWANLASVLEVVMECCIAR